MSISDNYSPIKIQGNNVTDTFSGSWAIFNKNFLVAELEEIGTGIITPLVVDSDYTLSFDSSGFVLTTSSPVSSDYYIIIYRDIPLNQEQPYSTNKGFQGEVLETALDKITGICQDIRDDLDRAPKLPVTSSAVGDLPLPVAGRALKWNDDENAIINTDVDIDDAIDIATAQASVSTTQAGIATGAAVTAVNARDAILNNTGFQTVSSDLLGANTIGVVASDLSGDNNIGTVADNILNVIQVSNSIDNVNIVSGMEVNIQDVVDNMIDINNATSNAQDAIDAKNLAEAAARTATSQAAKLTGTSTTSVEIGTGSKVFTTQADKDFNGNNVRVYSDADPTNFMDGLASYSGTTLTVTVTAIGGSGTFTDWTIRVNGARGATGAAGSVTDGDKGDITVTDSGGTWTLDPTAITGKTEAVIASGDYILFSDTDDTGALKKDTVQGIIDLIPASPNAFTATDTISATADWDTLVTAGLYKTKGTNYTNGPLFSLDTTGSLSVRTISGDANRIVQVWVEGATSDVWKRGTSNGGTTWTMWRLVGESAKATRWQKMLNTSKVDTAFAPATTTQYIDGFETTLANGGSVNFMTVINSNAQTKFKGALKVETGASSATGSARIGNLSFGRGNLASDSGFFRIECYLGLYIASSGTHRFTVTVGSDKRASEGVNFFSYTDTENSGKWVCVTDNGGTETVTKTSVTPTATTDIDYMKTTADKLRVEVENNTKIRFYINDVLVGTHTTNIGANLFGTPIAIVKSVGTGVSAVAFFADYTYQYIGE